MLSKKFKTNTAPDQIDKLKREAKELKNYEHLFDTRLYQELYKSSYMIELDVSYLGGEIEWEHFKKEVIRFTERLVSVWERGNRFPRPYWYDEDED